ncbi:MAG: TetR family transcriptional regulator [Syntrophaceae bacterium]
MKISELSSRADIPVSTIKYYLRQGLLPAPLSTGKNMAYYSEAHLECLLAIPKMQAQGMSLDTIREHLPKLAHAQAPIHALPHSSRRLKITRSATELFRTKGYHATNIADIVKHAGIGRGTFYQYFPNKEALFLECADSIFQDIDREFVGLLDESDVLKRLKQRALLTGRSYQHLIEMLNLARGASVKGKPQFQDKLAQVMHNLVEPIQRDVEKGVEQGLFRIKNSTLIAYLLLGAIEYGFYYFSKHPVDTDNLISQGWDIIMNGGFPTVNQTKTHEK